MSPARLPFQTGCFHALQIIVGSRLLDTAAGIFAHGTVRQRCRLRADGKIDADKIANQAAAALYEGIRTQTLPNGLRVYLKPIPGAPVVTSMVAYKVGSADENLDTTGLSHYLEHLMFKGTDKIMPGDIDRRTLRTAGHNNAYTNEDITIYHFDFSADHWEVALDIEADRMQNLRIDTKHEFEQEKGAVVAELDADEDSPWDLEHKTILPILFGKGPYGHPVIGEREHVRAATAKIIKAHYDKWYHPNNAALVVVGGFDPDKAMAKIKTLFGPIPAAQLPPRKPEVAITRDKPVHKEIVSKFQSPRMLMGFNTVRSGGPGFYAMEVVQDILTGGKTGRLYTKLVDELALASGVSASNQAGRYAGWFNLQVELVNGKSREAAEKAVVDELKRLQTEPVSAAELARVKRGLLAAPISRGKACTAWPTASPRACASTTSSISKTTCPAFRPLPRKTCKRPPASSSTSIRKWLSGRFHPRPKAARSLRCLPSRNGMHAATRGAALKVFRWRIPSVMCCPMV